MTARKKISEVREGEEVLTRDQLTGDLSCRQVVHPYFNPDRAIIELTLLDEDGDFEVLETTDNHPFFVLGRGWTRVDELEIGDLVPSPDGQLEVVGLVWTGELETVYNFGGEKRRSYVVGELGAWVHNCVRKLWEVTKDRTDRVLKGPKGKYYRHDSSDLYWSKDLDGHGGSVWKVHEESKRGLQWIFDADKFGDSITGKHKGPSGKLIPWSKLNDTIL